MPKKSKKLNAFLECVSDKKKKMFPGFVLYCTQSCERPPNKLNLFALV